MLKRIKLQNYKKFVDGEFQFAPGVNVIVGKNEAGKSTLLSAIFTGLFTDATTKARNFFENAVSWQSGSREISLELEFSVRGEGSGDTQEKSYILTRDYKNGKQLFRDLTTQESSDDYQKISRLLAAKVHVPGEEVFLATAFVRQAEITNIQFNKDLRTALQKVVAVSKDGGNLELNLLGLEREVQQLRLGLDRPSKNQGAIKSTQIELESAKSQLQQKRQLWEKALAAKQASDNAGGKLGELEEKIKAAEKVFENYRRLEDGKKQLDLLEGHVLEITGIINQVKSESLQLKQIASEMQALGDFNSETVLNTSDELLKLRQVVKTSKESLAELNESFAEVDSSRRINYLQLSQGKEQARRLFELGTSGILAGALLGLAGVFMEMMPAIILGFGILGLSAALLGLALVRSLSAGKEAVVNDENPEAKALKMQIEAVTQKISSSEAQIKEILTRYNLDNAADFFTRKAKYLTLVDERKRLEHTIKGYLNGKDLAEVEQKQVEMLAAQKDIETQELTPEVRAAEMSPNEYLRKRRELDMLLIERKRLEKDTTRNDVISEEVDVNYDDLVLLEEKVDLLTTRLASLEKRRTVLETTINLLKQVMQSTGQAASTVVSAEVEKYLPKLTGGRYKDLRLSENYDLEVFSTEKNDWLKPLAKLSLGTVDQIYLLARLALGKTLAGGKLHYLFLDDPFVTFDHERLQSMREILNEMGQETQIFIFTHNPQYKDWGHVVEI